MRCGAVQRDKDGRWHPDEREAESRTRDSEEELLALSLSLSWGAALRCGGNLRRARRRYGDNEWVMRRLGRSAALVTAITLRCEAGDGSTGKITS